MPRYLSLPSAVLSFLVCICHVYSNAEAAFTLNNTSTNVRCPDYCRCSEPKPPSHELVIQDCTKDPVSDIDAEILAFPNISSLRITNSHLSVVPTVVCNLTTLQTLNLDTNVLNELPWGCLSRIDPLAHIIATNNNITVLRNGIFYGFQRLTSLDFTNNSIRHIEEDVFSNVSKLPHLTSLILNGNRLVSIDPWFLMFHDRKTTMRFDNNQISRFTNRPGWIFKCGMKPPDGTFTATWNKITYIIEPLAEAWNITDMTALCLSNGRPVVDLRNNPFHCDCKDFKLYSLLVRVYQSPYATDLHCRLPETLYHKKIVSIPLYKFICHLKKECPSECDCIDTPDWLNMTASCPHAGLVTLPDTIPERPKINYRYHLFLQQNNLTSIDSRPYFKYVETLVLGGNHISNLSVEVLKELPNLKRLYLENNDLKRLPFSPTFNLSTVAELRFNNNPWICDCHSLATKYWLVNHKNVISDWKAVLCMYPDRLRGTNLLTLADDQFICGDPPNKQQLAIVISISGTSAAAIVLMVLPLLFLYVKRIWIYKTFKWHPYHWDECKGEDMLFDVFVSYADEDEEYVEKYLIPTLGQHCYRVCFHRKHFLPGTSILTNIEQAVYKSKRTLVFLSNAFLVSDFCRWEFNLALNRDLARSTHRLVVIKDTSLDDAKIDEGMRKYLGRITYVKRESDVFWDNLLYSLPVNKLNSSGDNDATVLDEPLLNYSDLPTEGSAPAGSLVCPGQTEGDSVRVDCDEECDDTAKLMAEYEY